MVLKDNIDVGGHKTSLGAGAEIAVYPERDAAAVAALRRAGAVFIGKAAMHALAFGATSDNDHFGPTRNPWSLDRMAGGSSGGSAAAIAADLSIAALGTDTGGSIRIPAALCGVVGLRPTFGSVPTAGLHATSWSLDTIGPLARSAVDVGNVLAALTGHPTSGSRAVRGIRVGVAKGPLFEDVDPGVADAVCEALEIFQNAGARLVNIELEGAETARAFCSAVLHVEALAEYETRFLEHPTAFGEAVRRRLGFAQSIPAMAYARALRWRADWAKLVDASFDRADVIMTPTVPFVAPLIIGTEMISTTASLTRLTYPWSFASVPAMSIPCGFSDRLPVGLQLVARSGDDHLLLALAAAYQLETDYHRQRPPMQT
jgi:aspartyl-tRNA(Asn)/glutamyl-tRNA(Gln) amidotransferase subunit A